MKRIATSLILSVVAGLLAAPVVAQSDVEPEGVTLQQALKVAAEQNETWEIAEQRIEQSRAIRRQTLALMLPSLSASAVGTYNGVDVEFQGRSITQRWDWSTGAQASLTLLDLSNFPLYARSKRLVEATEADAAWARRTLLVEVEQAFFELAAAEREVAIARNTVELRQAYVEQAEALVESGIALPLDVARARSQRLEADQALVVALARLGNQSDSLEVLLGQRPSGALRAMVAEEELVAPPAGFGQPDLARRADLRVQAYSIEAQELAADAIWWSLFPTLTLSGQGRFGESSFSAPDGYTWSVSLTLGWLLYDGGARYARLNEAESRTTELELELQRAKRQAVGLLGQSLRSWRAAFEAIAVADEKAEVARQAFEMTRARFDAGLATSVEVNESSDALFRAENDLNQAVLQARLARAQYRYLSELQ